MGKGGKAADEKKADKPDEILEVFIDGKLYDVTDFMKTHPGGTVIKFYAGQKNDATQAFNNFHHRSEKAKKMLANLKSREATDVKQYNPKERQSEMLAEFNAMTKDFQDLGYFKPNPLHVMYRIVEIFLMHFIGFYLLLKVSNQTWDLYRWLGLFVLGLATGRCGWLMHEGGHNSLTGWIKMDRIIQIFMYGVGCGMSGGWWRSQHNRHHAMPQKLGSDPDLDTLPLVLFSSSYVAGKLSRLSGLQKVWIKVQPFLFPVVTTLLVSSGWQFFLHPRYIVRKNEILEGISLFIRYFCIYFFLGTKYGAATTILMYVIYNWIGSNYIFINFAVSHTHLPTVAKDDTSVDWVRYAAEHTMNVNPGPLKFVNWWMSYLNFQIEHHLYPAMPQFRHPLISPRIKDFFKKYGLQYKTMNYTDAMAVTFENLDKVGSDVYLG